MGESQSHHGLWSRGPCDACGNVSTCQTRAHNIAKDVDRIDSEEDLAAPDWLVRAGPETNRHRRKEKGRGRTHHRITKQKIEDQSRRPTIAFDYYFMKMKSVVVAQTMSEEAVVCTAMEEDRHQNIMSSVALKKGVEEPWTIQKVALGYREITLKSDTEPAIIAFRNRVAEMCKAEVTTEDKLKIDKRIERAHRERSDADTWNHPNHQVSH